MRKKGVIGASIVSFPALLISIAIIATFLVFALTGSIFTKKGTNLEFREFNLDKSSFLLKEVTGKNSLVIDLIAKSYAEGKEGKNVGYVVGDFLRNITKEEKSCLFIYEDTFLGEEVFSSLSDGVLGNSIDSETSLVTYKDKSSKTVFSVKGKDGLDKKVVLVYYYGECLHVK